MSLVDEVRDTLAQWAREQQKLEILFFPHIITGNLASGTFRFYSKREGTSIDYNPWWNRIDECGLLMECFDKYGVSVPANDHTEWDVSASLAHAAFVLFTHNLLRFEKVLGMAQTADEFAMLAELARRSE